MTLELNQEQAAAIFVLAVGELQAIKAEELDGFEINTAEVETLYSLARSTNPDPSKPVPDWAFLPPLPDEDDDGGELVESQV